MRIIGGIHRTRTILAPVGKQTSRPVTDRVKENLFNRLMAMGLPSAEPGTQVLDIFSGTGSLGLEALSRGADHCTFVENDPTTRKLLEQNLQTLGLTEQATVLPVDALSLNWLSLLPPKPVELIFCDPPYTLTRDPQTMKSIQRLIEALAEAAEPGAVLILRTEAPTAACPAGGWHEPRTNPHGAMLLHVYLRAG
ncbi:MAG: RsmD family RNA methyltransferase [Phycisphaeraceae bacterium]